MRIESVCSVLCIIMVVFFMVNASSATIYYSMPLYGARLTSASYFGKGLFFFFPPLFFSPTLRALDKKKGKQETSA